MTAILGLNLFHADASACLVKDGVVVAAVAEERLGSRKKHFAGFPALAIGKVLDIARVSLSDIDCVAVGHDGRANLWQKAAFSVRHPARAFLAGATFLARAKQTQSVPELIVAASAGRGSSFDAPVMEVEHHVAHLASSYYSSGYDEAAGFSYDASGDFVSTMYARCADQAIEVLDRVHLPHSLGYFYTALCQFIGFDHFGEEYKVMGLAAYGKPRFAALMARMLEPLPHGRFRLNPAFFSGVNSRSHMELGDAVGDIVVPTLYSTALEEVLGPPRHRGGEITQRDCDVAASCQLHFEEVVLHCLRWLHTQVPLPALVTAGGCALNGVCNARILRESPFRSSYIHCAAGDDGTAVGAALYAWHSLHKGIRVPAVGHAYLGPEYSDAVIRDAIAASGYEAVRLERAELLSTISGYLAEGKIVGWYQGRCEWGPRALGNRSILAHPGWPGMKELINLKIKRRESFRPFAPSILIEHVDAYFEQHVESPFMMHVASIRPERRAELAAVTHEDGTGRLQTVSRESNELYYDLIERFRVRTGTPVLLNTSFNENEPIVDTPQQALDCFGRNDIDVLCLGSYVVRKT
jgi:carbamoyltransferase